MDYQKKKTFELFVDFFTKAMRICNNLCENNGIITPNTLLSNLGEFRNITTFELANGWQLDYRIDRFYFDHCIHFDVDPTKCIFFNDLGYHITFSVYGDGRRFVNSNETYNAIFQISIDRDFDGVTKNYDKSKTYINPRLFQIIKMNQNNLDALNHDLFLNSIIHDSYGIKHSVLYGNRIIQNSPIESYIMNELIESLDDIKIIKSTLYDKEEEGYSLEGKEIKLPLKAPIEKTVKKNINI